MVSLIPLEAIPSFQLPPQIAMPQVRHKVPVVHLIEPYAAAPTAGSLFPSTWNSPSPTRQLVSSFLPDIKRKVAENERHY